MHVALLTFLSVHGRGLSSRSPNPVVDAPGTWHSQAGQDRIVFNLVGRNGFFVDLAANEPVTLSNTRTLERDYQWRGLCIDGNAELVTKLRAVRSCQVINAVVSEQPGREIAFLESGPNGGVLSNSTKNRRSKPGMKVSYHRTVTLQSILRRAQAPDVIDFLSLDIEGAEYDALSTFFHGPDPYTFRVITVERPKMPLRALLRNNSYIYVRDNPGCFGDQLWVHSSMVETAQRALGLSEKLNPAADNDRCCKRHSTIDGNCCADSNSGCARGRQ